LRKNILPELTTLLNQPFRDNVTASCITK